MCKYEICCKKKNCCRAYKLTPENAQDILDMMGYSNRAIECMNQYGDERHANITPRGIEFGSRYELGHASYDDYIIDYDGGRRMWAIYPPEEFYRLFYVINE